MLLFAVNAYLNYLNWAGSPHKLKQLREPKVVMPTFTEDPARLLLRYKPKTDFQRRLHLLIRVLFDTGARISEVLGLQSDDVDLDNMLLRLRGKGRKERLVPMSFELRLCLDSRMANTVGYLQRRTEHHGAESGP
jgi:integrase/recombinase XerD